MRMKTKIHSLEDERERLLDWLSANGQGSREWLDTDLADGKMYSTEHLLRVAADCGGHADMNGVLTVFDGPFAGEYKRL